MGNDLENKTTENEQKESKKQSGDSIARKLTVAKSGKSLALHIVLEVLAPYAYLMLCGLVFDFWLHLYNMTTFIFISYVLLQLVGVVLALLCVINYNKMKKSEKNNKK